MRLNLVSLFLQRQRYLAALPYLRGDVLDLGCNTGQILECLKPGQQYVGVDSSSGVAAWWQRTRPGVEFHLRNLDCDALGLGRRFDTVLMLAILEHLGRPENILSQMPEVLQPAGRLVITTPSVLGDRIHHVGAKLGIFSRAAAEEHQAQFTEQSLRQLLSAQSLAVSHYRRFLFGGNQLCVAEFQR